MIFTKTGRQCPVLLIKSDVLARTKVGIKKQLKKEENRLNEADPEDREYVAKRKDNIRRLRIIRDELKKLEKQL